MGRHREFDPDEALQAALALFWQKGYEGTSLGDLCAATGVARPGLYSAFGNKNALFLKVLDRYESKHLSFMQDALEETTSGKVVDRILRGTVTVVTKNSGHPGCLGVNGALACSQEAEPVRQELVRRKKASEVALQRRFERAVDEGDLPDHTDCAMLAKYIMTFTQGLAVQAKAGTSRKALSGTVDFLLSSWPGREH